MLSRDRFRSSAPRPPEQLKPFDFATDPCVEQGLTFAYDEPATTTTVAAVKAFLTAALKEDPTRRQRNGTTLLPRVAVTKGARARLDRNGVAASKAAKRIAGATSGRTGRNLPPSAATLPATMAYGSVTPVGTGG
jgi:hypothetical protein